LPAEPCEWTQAYDRLIRLFMAGRLQELRAQLDSDGLLAGERGELESLIAFAQGRLSPSARPNPLAWLIWAAWVIVPFGAVVCQALLHAIMAAAHALGIRALSFAGLRERFVPALVHCRYTNFVNGLAGAALLHAAARPNEHPVDHAYYLGLIGMFECACGRWDYGLESFRRADEQLMAIHARFNASKIDHAGAYERLMAVTTLRALYLGHAGRHDDAYPLYARALGLMSTHGRYVLIEIFLYSTRMSCDLETMNAESLAQGTAALKQILGEHFASTFAPRAAVYSSLIATLQGNLEFARQQLAFSDRHYTERIAAVEQARYHLLRALIHLELWEDVSARLHAGRATAVLSRVPGARFHHADALLLRLEVQLRLRVRAAHGPLSRRIHRRIARAIRSTHRGLRGNELGRVRVSALRAFLAFAQEDFATVQRLLPPLIQESERISKRLRLVLSEIDIRDGRFNLPLSARADVESKRELSLLERFAQIIHSDAADPDAAELFRYLVGGERYTIERRPSVGNESLAIEMRDQPNRVVIPIAGAGETVLFIVEQPLVDVRIDLRCRDLLRLAAAVVELAIRKRALAGLERIAAVARTTQMLAHDVRRPFTTLRMGLEALRAAGNEQEMRSVVETFLPAVDTALTQVTGLLSDITQFGSTATLHRESVLPEVLLRGCLTEAFRSAPNVDVEVSYELLHDRALEVDATRVERVLSNIMVNALQAIGQRGRMWIRTRPAAAGEFLEVVIGNDGPSIDAAHLPHVFEPFFTRNKAQGTGLGLAIARQMVIAHGGEIECRVVAGAGVEFCFTLPAATAPAESQALAEARAQLPLRARDGAPPGSEHPSELARKLAGRLDRVELATLTRPLRVLIVDDEPAYAEPAEKMIRALLGPHAEIAVTGAADQAMATARRHPPHLIFVDLQLGEDDGLELVRAWRADGTKALICVHSNDNSEERQQAARQAGADLVLPKPLHRDELRGLVERALAAVPVAALPQVGIVDDSRAVIAGWKLALRGQALVHGFTSPEALLLADESEDLLSSLAILITDLRFEDSARDGLSLARAVRQKCPQLPIAVSSSGLLSDADIIGVADVLLDKAARSWSELQPIIEAAARRTVAKERADA
jgi:signal transduction histidine kinase/DNA-binding NarL/FixJ family response regulator